MPKFDYDLYVIGAGSGGVRASRIAAGHGARTGICEEDRVGGTCVIRGCVPKKLLVYASHFHEDFEDAAGYGWTVGASSFDWSSLIANKDREIDRLNQAYKRTLANAGVELHEQRGVLVDPHTIEVGGKAVTADKILIAVGGWPNSHPFPGVEHTISSNEAFHLTELPKRVLVAGGGYIAVEFAGIFNGLGSEVTQIYRGPKVLRGFDEDVRDVVQAEMVKKGVTFRLNQVIDSVTKTADGLQVTFSDGSVGEFDQVMMAIGRHPKTEALGLASAGVDVNSKGAIPVNEYSKTNVDHIYAVGDVTDRINLTPVALMEGHAFADTEFGNRERAVDHHMVPSAVFSQPPVGSVGLAEHDAAVAFGDLDIYRSKFRPMKHTLSGRDEQTMMKLVVARSSQKVVGFHMVGMDAAEITQGVAIAMKMGATKADFDATIGIHPTAAEELVTMREPVSQ